MAKGSPTTTMNLALPVSLVLSLDMTRLAWQHHGFSGDRRDVIEALLSYAFFLHRRELEPETFPPTELAMMKFLHPLESSRASLEFDPTPYIATNPEYDPRKWGIQ